MVPSSARVDRQVLYPEVLLDAEAHSYFEELDWVIDNPVAEGLHELENGNSVFVATQPKTYRFPMPQSPDTKISTYGFSLCVKHTGMS